MQYLSKLTDLSLKYEDSTVSLYAPIRLFLDKNYSTKIISFKPGTATKPEDLFLNQVGMKALRILSSGLDEAGVIKVLHCSGVNYKNITHLNLAFFFDGRPLDNHQIAKFMEYLPNLTSADLSYFSYLDVAPIIKSLSNCQNLTHIDISGLRSDSLSQEAVDNLAACVNLTSLVCFNAVFPSNITTRLATLPKLTDLEIRDGSQKTYLQEGEEEDLNALAPSKSLKRVFYSLRSKKTTKMDKLLQARPDLLALNTKDNDLEKLTDQLEDLTISHSRPRNLVADLDKLTKKCQKIASFDVRECADTDEGMSRILDNLPLTLSSLKIARNPGGIDRFTHLHTLAVISTAFPPKALALILSRCVLLKDLDLHHSKFDNNDFTALPKASQLEILDLTYSNIDEKGIAAIAGKTLYLERFILDNCQINDKAIDDLLVINPPLLTFLSLSHCEKVTIHAVEAIYRSTGSNIRELRCRDVKGLNAFKTRHPDYTKRFDFISSF